VKLPKLFSKQTEAFDKVSEMLGNCDHGHLCHG